MAKSAGAVKIEMQVGHDGRRPILGEPKNLGKYELAINPDMKRNHNHCVLCRLHFRGHLRDPNDKDEKTAQLRHKAGEALQRDFSKAGLASMRGSMASILAPSHGGQCEIANMKFEGGKRLEAALKAVGFSARFLLTKIVLEDWTAEQCAVILHQHKKAVIPCLRMALDTLMQHYGIAPSAKDANRPGRIRAETIHPFQAADAKCS